MYFQRHREFIKQDRTDAFSQSPQAPGIPHTDALLHLKLLQL